MEKNANNLMKHFASVLRNRALGKQTENLMSQNLAFYFARKELLEMITKWFDGTIPKEHNLMELEKKELLELVGDELFIISYVTEKWSREAREAIVKKPEPIKASDKGKDASQKKAENPKKS